MINVISVPQALGVQFTATPKARRGPCIAVPQGAAVVPIILLILNSPYQSHCYQISKVIVTKFPKSLLLFFQSYCYKISKHIVTKFPHSLLLNFQNNCYRPAVKLSLMQALYQAEFTILCRTDWPSGCNFGIYSTFAMTLVDKRTVESVSTSRAHVVTDTFVKTYVSGVFKRSEPLQAGNGAEKSFRWAK